MLKAIHAQEDRQAAQNKAGEVIGKLRTIKLSKAAELVESHIEETFSFYAFPDQHWIKLKTTDVIDKRFLWLGLLFWAVRGRPRGEERAWNWKVRGAA
jgi:transposase-like protein